MKKLLQLKTLIFLICAVLTSIGASAYDFYVGGIYYKQHGLSSVEVTYKNTNYNSYSGSVVIPSTFTYNGKTYTVIRIGEKAFKDCTGLTSVSIPSTVGYLGNWAFSGCTSLKSILIPDCVTEVGVSVMLDCKSLTSVTIGTGLTKLNDFMFCRCTSLEEINIPDNVKEIGTEVFEDDTKLRRVTLGSGMKSLGNYVFSGCTALRTVVCRAATPPTLTSITFDSSHYSNSYFKVLVPYLSQSSYKAANYWKNFSSWLIAYDFAAGGIYYSRTSSNTVQVIYRDENRDSYSGYVSIPSTVANGGTTYTVTAIGPCAFMGTNEGGHLTGVYIPTSVKVIDNDAFWLQGNLASVTIPSSVTTIGSYAFCWCSKLTSITIPNSVKSIGNDAFAECKSLVTATLGTGISKIERETFYQCEKLSSITIPNNVKTIESRAFMECKAMTTVNMSNAVTSIGSEAFATCPALTNFSCLAVTPPTLQSNTFDVSHYSAVTLQVPMNYKSVYQAANYWKNFTQYLNRAYDFYVSPLYFIITSASTVGVAPKSVAYNSYSGSISIPAAVTYNSQSYNVTSVSNNAFKNCYNLTSLNLGSVTSLGDWAVSGCSKLTSITIPNTVTSVGTSVLMDCSALKNVTIGSGLKTIGNFMFIRCKALEEIVIPNTVTSMGYEVFEDCSALKKVTLGTGLQSIGNFAFKGCSALKTIVSQRSTPPTLTSSTFDSNTYTSADVYVPYPALSAYKAANYWKNFTNITSEGEYDFVVNGIYYRITGTNTVCVTSKSSDGNTYSGNVNIPSNVTYSGKTYKVTAIDDYAFGHCGSLTSVTIPAGVTKIGEHAFVISTLQRITIPSTVTTIGKGAFVMCTKLTSVTLNEGLITLGESAFESCTALTSVTLPSTLSSMGKNAFSSTGLTSIEIPSKVTTIAERTFEGCGALKTVTLPSTLTSLGAEAFGGCSSLTTVTCMAVTPPTMSNANAFDDYTYNQAKLLVPAGSISAYKVADWWRKFNTITGLSFDFYVNGIYYKQLTSNTVEVTYKDANYNSYSGAIVVPSTIKVNSANYAVMGVGKEAFWKSTGLTSVKLPNTVSSIGERAFAQCTGLKTVDLGTGVKTIANMAFSNCTSLTAITIPSKVTKISAQAFEACRALTTVMIPDAVTSIGMYAFMNCSGLKTLTLGTGLTSMANSSFAGCTALTSVTSMAKVPPTMGDNSVFSTSTYNTAKLYVPRTSLNAYKQANWWRLFVSIVGIDAGADPCDVNGDGEVTVSDVNAVIDAILYGLKDPKFDVDGDGEVSVNDVNLVIETILSRM